MQQGYEGKIRIEVDGGVGVANIKEVAEAGADMFVAGSAILKVTNILTITIYRWNITHPVDCAVSTTIITPLTIISTTTLLYRIPERRTHTPPPSNKCVSN